MSIRTRTLPCGCKVYREDGRGPWPVEADADSLSAIPTELCVWARAIRAALTDAFFEAGDVTDKVARLDKKLARHASGTREAV